MRDCRFPRSAGPACWLEAEMTASKLAGDKAAASCRTPKPGMTKGMRASFSHKRLHTVERAVVGSTEELVPGIGQGLDVEQS